MYIIYFPDPPDRSTSAGISWDRLLPVVMSDGGLMTNDDETKNPYWVQVCKDGHLYGLYELIEKRLDRLLPKFPLVTQKYGSADDPGAWAMKFIYLDPDKDKDMDSLEYTPGPLNPDLVRILSQHSEKDSDVFYKDLYGEIRHWLVNLFYKTEFGRTRFVLNRDMKQRPDVFAQLGKNVPGSPWRLTDSPDRISIVPLNRLWLVAKNHSALVRWPPREEFEKFRRGERDRRPHFNRDQVRALMKVVLKEADGAVMINDLTKAFIACQPYIVNDDLTLVRTNVDIERLSDGRNPNDDAHDDGEHTSEPYDSEGDW